MKKNHHGVPLLLLSAAISKQVYGAVNDDFTSTNSDTPVTIDVLANDDAISSSFELVVTDYGQPAYGSLILNSDQTFTYTPDQGFEGQDVFSYQATNYIDGVAYGGADAASVTIDVVAAPTGEASPLAELVTGESNRVTASMLDAFCSTPSDSLRNACAELSTLANNDTDTLKQLISEITPDEVLAQRRVLAETLRNQTHRLYASHQLLTRGTNVGALSMNTLMINSLAENEGGIPGGFPPWALFGSLEFGQSDHDQTTYESAYDADTRGLMLGINYRIRTNLDVGVALDYSSFEAEYDSSDLDSNVYSLNGFAFWSMQDSISLDMTLGYSTGSMTTHRTIQLNEAEGDTNSNHYFLSTQVQYTYNRKALTALPYARLEYIAVEVDDYSETGNTLWLMNVGKQKLDQVSFSVGVDTTYAFNFDWGVMVPSLNLSAINEGNQDFEPVTFDLVNDGGSNSVFQLRADGEDNLYFKIGANSVFVLQGGLSTFIGFQFLEGYDNINAYSVQAGFNFEL